MLRVEREFTLDHFEASVQRVAGGERSLQLPYSIKTIAAGTLVALLQLIITWARAGAENTVLRLYSEPTDTSELTRFARTPFGLTALNMAAKISAQSGLTIERSEILSLSRDYVIGMAEKPVSALREFDKSTFPFICIDNAREYRRPNRLYLPGTDRVRERSDFSSLVRSCASLLPSERRLNDPEMFEAAASLLFEAFQNTHDHAQTDHRGEIYRRSTRGLMIGFQYVPFNMAAHFGGSSLPLRSYYQNWRPDFPGARHAQFLELGVFDSGPGLARRWLAKDVALASRLPEGNSLQEEYQAVLKCLLKGATTKSASTSGNGLYRIMQVVKRSGGLIRIRTGNLSLVKAFEGGNSLLTDDDLFLDDLGSGERPVSQYQWVEGTTLSVLLPINRSVWQ